MTTQEHTAIVNARAQLIEYHEREGIDMCPGPGMCPCAAAIRDCDLALAEHALANPEAEATYPPMEIHDVANAVIEAQSKLGQ